MKEERENEKRYDQALLVAIGFLSKQDLKNFECMWEIMCEIDPKDPVAMFRLRKELENEPDIKSLTEKLWKFINQIANSGDDGEYLIAND